MTDRYFGTARREIIPHLPSKVERMLDIGCGRGATVTTVKERHALTWVGGVEIVPDEAEKAKAVCDRVWSIDIEREDFERDIAPGSLDLVLCLDVLEHLVDPWAVVRRLSVLLAPKGRLIVSVPNIRNWKFIRNLLFKGDFQYRDSGLLDRTHLRFFVRQTAEQLAIAGGLGHLRSVALPDLAGFEARHVIVRASGGRLADIFAKQWLIVAERAA